MADPEAQGTPIPVKTGTGLNPTWGQAATPPPGASGPPPASPLPPAAPTASITPVPPLSASPATFAAAPPIQTSPPASTQPKSEARTPSVPLVSPTAPTLPPPSLVPPVPPQFPPADLSLTPPARPPLRIPWRSVLIVLGTVSVLGGLGGYLWWQGIGIGMPRDPKLALLKMATRFGAVGSYAFTGEMKVSVSAQSATAEVSDLKGLASSSASTTESSTSRPAAVDSRESVTIDVTFSGERADARTSDVTFVTDLSEIPTTVLPSSLPDAIEFEVRRVQQDIYVRSPLLAAILADDRHPWFVFANANQESRFLQDVDQAQLAGLIVGGQRIGYEKIGQTRVGHYQVTLDPVALVRLVRPDLLTLISADQLATRQVMADLWLGTGDYLPYKITLTSASNQAATVPLTADLTLNFLKYQTAFSISPPETSQLTTQALSQFNWHDLKGSLEKTARDSQRKADLRQVKAALERYFFEQKEYPKAATMVRTSSAGTTLDLLVTRGYLKALPLDPDEPTHWYGYESDGVTYQLSAVLENTSDSDGVVKGTITLFLLMNDLPSAANEALTTPTLPPASTATPSPFSTTGRLPSP